MKNEASGKKCVLVVDNEPRILDVVSLLLQAVEYDVVTASSGAQAIDLLRNSKFDAVLLDLIMPGMNGDEVLKSLRTFSQIPVILFSAMPIEQEEALKLGADGAIAKAVELDYLVKKIEDVIQSKHSLSQASIHAEAQLALINF